MVKKKSAGAREEKKNIPEGVILIAVYFFFMSLSFAGMAFQVFLNTDNPEVTLGGSFEELSRQNALNSEMYFVAIGLLIIVIAAIFYVIGRGILRFDKRARIVAIVFFALGIVTSFSLMVMPDSAGPTNFFWTSILMIAIHGLALGYLLRKDVAGLYS